MRTEWARSKRFRPAVIPLFVVGVPVVAFLVLQFRTLDRFEARTAQVLGQGSAQLATRIGNRFEDDLKSPLFNFLERINHTAVRRLDLDRAARDIRESIEYAKLLDAFFIWSAGPKTAGTDAARGEILFYPIATRRGGTPFGFSGRAIPVGFGFYRVPELSEAIRRKVQEFADLGSSYGLVYDHVDGREMDLIYHLLYDRPESTNLEAFMGFTVDTRFLLEDYFAPVARQMLSEEAGSGLAPLQVSIFDHNGREVFRSDSSLEERFENEHSFPFFFFDVDLIRSWRWFTPEVRHWKIRTAYPEGSVAVLARRQVNQQRALWLLVALVAIAGMTLTIRALMDEARLARMKSDFVASVSHDLKTPLSSITMFAETLESGRARNDEKVRQYARIIRTEAARLQRLIEGILNFSRMESGDGEYPLEDVDLGAVLAESLDSFEHQLREGGFRTEIDFPRSTVVVRANREGLLQVFSNLISNAIKYSRSDRFLRVSLSALEGIAVVEVCDHGVGIPSHEQANVFRKFYRLVEDSTIEETGTGIGLATVAHVVQALNGRVRLQSKPGEGSRFTVELPLAEASSA